MAVAVLLGACASAASDGSGGSRDVITAEQLAELPSLSAHEVIEQLKPRWLRRRGQDSLSGNFRRAVIVNGIHRGGLEVLERFSASDLREIRYMDASQAQMRFGDRAGGGAILLTTIGG